MLKEKFPGVRISHDVCSVESLPDVCISSMMVMLYSCEIYYDSVMVVVGVPYGVWGRILAWLCVGYRAVGGRVSLY